MADNGTGGTNGTGTSNGTNGTGGLFEAGATEHQLIQANIHQSIATSVQNATDLLNNICSIESTVIGVASAKWLEEPANLAYKEIIDSAKDNITFAVDNLKAVGEAGQSVLENLKPQK
ncbi:MAG: hypothetical protein ACI8WB_002559 [Phenylobacterium sp.]|jgi:hypothetical protein